MSWLVHFSGIYLFIYVYLYICTCICVSIVCRFGPKLCALSFWSQAQRSHILDNHE